MEVEIAISKLMEAFRVPEIDRFQYAEAVSALQEFRRPAPRAVDGFTCPACEARLEAALSCPSCTLIVALTTNA